VTSRYRCTACGNLTRFDVVATRRTRAFWHYTVGGELSVEEEQVLDAVVEAVVCRWCSASGPAIEEIRLPGEDLPGEDLPGED
jgi:3-polyprenyl-4-hydroxybenzoate decarboxylase